MQILALGWNFSIFRLKGGDHSWTFSLSVFIASQLAVIVTGSSGLGEKRVVCWLDKVMSFCLLTIHLLMVFEVTGYWRWGYIVTQKGRERILFSYQCLQLESLMLVPEDLILPWCTLYHSSTDLRWNCLDLHQKRTEAEMFCTSPFSYSTE